jgi:hypothetical protein
LIDRRGDLRIQAARFLISRAAEMAKSLKNRGLQKYFWPVDNCDARGGFSASRQVYMIQVLIHYPKIFLDK